MESRELLDIIEQLNECDAENTILEANEILDVLNHRSKFAQNFEEAIINFAYENNRCEYCGQELEHAVFKESREYMGFDECEEIHISVCKNSNCSNSYS